MMNTYADKSQKPKSKSAITPKKQKNGSATFQLIDKRSEAVTQRKLQTMANKSNQVSQLHSLQEISKENQKNSIISQKIIQRQKESLSPMNGFKKGLKTSTIDRLGLPVLGLGSKFSFSLLGSALITPLLTEKPTIPSEIKSYTSGFAGGFLSGTLARKFVFKKIRIPGIIDNLMTISNINKTAIKIDEYFNENPTQRTVAEKFINDVSRMASKQHKRTNPYMTPSSPDSIAEIQSPF